MRKRIDRNKYIALAFIVPLMIMLFIMLIMQIRPFGDFSLLVSDANAQYIDRIMGFRNIVLEDKSIAYTWSQIQGSMPYSFLGWDPFYLVYLGIDEKNILDMITLVMSIKIGLAGLSFSLFLRKVFKRNDLSISIFSWCYALMGFSLSYHFLFDFINPVIMLPLILYGVERIIDHHKNYLFFTLALTQMFIMSYYMSYMCGIFAFIYFMYRLYTLGYFYNIKAFKNKCISFIISPCLAFLCSSFILVPVFSIISGRDGLFNPEELGMHLRYEVEGILSKLFIGSVDTILPGGLPYLYCGIITLILIGVYFNAYTISYKEKMVSFWTLCFLFVSLTFNPLYVAWQGFKPPVYFEARFSFVISFFMVFLAYRGFCNWKAVPEIAFNKICLVLFVIMVLISRKDYTFINDDMIIYSSIFIIIYYAIYKCWTKSYYPKYKLKVLIGLVVFMELLTNTYQTFMRLDSILTYPLASEYEESYETMREITKEIKAQDQSFYRMEYIEKRGLNDGFGVGFPSITHFDSVYNYEVKEAVGRLGLATGHNWVEYENSTPIVDLLLNVKYVMSKEKAYMGYINNGKNNQYNIYRNPYAVSVGMMSSHDLNNLSSKPILEKEEEMMNLMLDKKESYYTLLESQNKQLINLGTKEIKEDITGYYVKNLKELGYIEYSVPVQEGGACFIQFKNLNKTNLSVQVNDEEVARKSNWTGERLYIGDYHKGQILTVKLILGKEVMEMESVEFYELNHSKLQEASAELKQGAFEIEAYSETQLLGTVNVEEGKSYLFTSIPYDEAWDVYVNDVLVEPIKVMDAFLGLKLENLGEHKIEFIYKPKGRVIGLVLTAIGWLVILTSSIIKFVKNKHKKNNSIE